MKYNIKFTLGSKKMQMIIKASSKDEAEYLLRGKLKIEAVEEIIPDNPKDIIDFLKGFKK